MHSAVSERNMHVTAHERKCSLVHSGEVRVRVRVRIRGRVRAVIDRYAL